MGIMKRVINFFFVTLGVIFFLIILTGTAFLIIDPYEIRPVLSSLMNKDSNTATSTNSEIVDKNPALSPTQESALEKIGVDPAKVPTSISSEQEACFEAKLGKDRVAAIKAGDSPTMTDYIKAKDCF